MSPANILLEACVESVEEALYAQRNGAHRLELCSDLLHDGLTPGVELLDEILSIVKIPVNVMIRPRAGDFVYDRAEKARMFQEVNLYKDKGVHGFVTGALLTDSSLDAKLIRDLAIEASPVPVTIHKCIDIVPDVFLAIHQLKEIAGIRAILSSGQRPTAMEGAEILREMVIACGSKLTIVVAGKVVPQNLEQLQQLTGAIEFHGRKIV